MIRKRILLLSAVLLGLLCIYGAGVRLAADPGMPLLMPEEGAQWIRFPQPMTLLTINPEDIVVSFRTRFQYRAGKVAAGVQPVLHLRAMKSATVLLDQRRISTGDTDYNAWKRRRDISLPALSPGEHELQIEVLNPKGHPALLAYAPQLGLATGEDWQASYDGKVWEKALLAAQPQSVPVSREFERVDHAVVANLWLFLPLFMAVLCFSLLAFSGKIPGKYLPSVRRVRWLLLLLWAGLAINNITKIPPGMGMDVAEHLKYIQFLLDNHRLPMANEGWQMFQPPLFYLLAALFLKPWLLFFPAAKVAWLIRLIPLLCGIAQVEISYRIMGLLFPDRNDLRTIGTVLGGLLPMNIYLSQVVGNEPLAGFFSAMVVLLFLRQLCIPAANGRGTLLIGLFWGLALLTKLTSVLLIMPMVIGSGFELLRNRQQTTGSGGVQPIVRLLKIIAIAMLVSGWYYLFSWASNGHIALRSENMAWWQEPGYRTLGQFWSFGQALSYPIYAATAGFLDSLYATFWLDGCLSGISNYAGRPPWNYRFLLASSWLSLPLALAMIAGLLAGCRTMLRGVFNGQSFAALCIMVYGAAILYVYLTLPVYSTGKATYAVGLSACFAAVGAQGLALVMRSNLARGVVYGVMACWALCVYCSYVVL